jgi:hypothetical protein
MHSTDLTGLDVPLAHLSCPTCGLLDTVCGEGLVPDVDVAGTWTGTDDLVVTLRTRGARTLWVAGSLRDKARGVEPYRHPLAAPTSELRLPPLDLSHDLHTLRLVCAGSTSWSLHRRRIACLPRTCRPASARHSQPHS